MSRKYQMDAWLLEKLYIEKRWAIPQIAGLLQVGQSTIHRFLARCHIPTRSIKEAKTPLNRTGFCRYCTRPAKFADICKSCGNHDYRERHKEELARKKKIYRDKNKARFYPVIRAWHLAHPERVRTIKEKWWTKVKRDPLWKSRHCFQENLRRAAKRNATPLWLSEEQKAEIQRIYEMCPAGWHVDHIIPLRGQNVQGLHVPWNLQYLSASKNRSKGNRLVCLDQEFSHG